MKTSAIIFVFLGIWLAYSHGQSHNVSWGSRGINDVQIHRAVVYKKSSFLRKVSTDFEFDLKQTPYVRSITQVVVTDQYTNGHGGYATLSAGGPPSSFVKIHFTSQRNHGLNFIVEIYGRIESGPSLG